MTTVAAPDFYDVLGVPRSAGSEELQQAFRGLARRYHPDINKDPEAEDRFKQVNAAYSVLSDPDQRSRYDRYGRDFRRYPNGAGAGPARPEPGAPTSGAAYGRGRTNGPSRAAPPPAGGAGAPSSGGVDVEDLFEGLFGGRGQGRGGGPIPGADQEADLGLTVEEVFRGGRRSMTTATGSEARTYTVDIPRGVIDGQHIRLAGEGGRGSGGGPPGDLYLAVRIAAHPRYRVHGRDISVDLPLSPWEAALGTRASIEVPSGSGQVRVPPGSSTGRRLRLRGEGLPGRAGDPAGDLYAEVKIMVPPAPTDREQALFEDLARDSTFAPRS